LILVRTPSSSVSRDGTGAGKYNGSSPVFVGLMYEIKVEDEPKPGAPSGGILSGTLILLSGLRLDGTTTLDCDRDGGDETDFRDD
jgi:hypothetical protein